MRGKCPPWRATSPAAQDSGERPAELAAVTRVDDGVHAAVEVTEPEDEFEDGFWRTQVCVEGDWKRGRRFNFFRKQQQVPQRSSAAGITDRSRLRALKHMTLIFCTNNQEDLVSNQRS